MTTHHLRWRRHPLARWLRRPAVHWSLVALVALVVAWRISAVVATARHERTQWGSTTTVAVAATDLSPGDPLSDATVRWTELPVAMVPEGHVTELPADATARSRINTGEVIMGHRTAGTGAGSGLPPGTAAVDVALPAAPARLEVGDLVDVVATFPVAPGAAPPSEIVSRDATVVGISDRTVSVAVDAGDLTAVVHATATGTVTLAVVG